MKKVLVLFSGGKDSLLMTLLLLEQGYIVYLVTYENDCGLNADAALFMAKRLVEKFGENRVRILGIKNVSPIWREFLRSYYNMTPSKILEEFGEVPISQFNCLSCRLSMYIASIVIARKNNIRFVAAGARKDQIFVIEQEPLLKKFVALFKKFNIELMFPMQDFNDDFDLKNQILIRGLVPKTYEPQCLIGMPLSKTDINQKVIESVENVYERLLKEKAYMMIEKYKEVDIAGEYF